MELRFQNGLPLAAGDDRRNVAGMGPTRRIVLPLVCVVSLLCSCERRTGRAFGPSPRSGGVAASDTVPFGPSSRDASVAVLDAAPNSALDLDLDASAEAGDASGANRPSVPCHWVDVWHPSLKSVRDIARK